MRVSSRSTIASILVILVMLASHVPMTGPARCPDGCADEGAGCADCPLCSSGRAPVLLVPDDGLLFAASVAPYEALQVLYLSRPEDHDVFHVPRQRA